MSQVKLASASIDERGKASGGKAGDQTEKEVKIQNYYVHSKGWRVFRPISNEIAEKIANDAEWAANNKNIGYDQWERQTLYRAASLVGFDCSKVTTPCETDCSALVRVCLAYAGISVPPDFRTSNEGKYLLESKKFIELTSDKYTKGSNYLRRGDILCTKTQGHTVIVISNGDDSEDTPNPPKYVEVTAKSVNVRTAPNTTGKVLGIVYKGRKLQYQGIDDKVTGWHLIEYKNQNGWITPKYTRLV
jgi:uncharacterized protein YgiM (DUF1202 family)